MSLSSAGGARSGRPGRPGATRTCRRNRPVKIAASAVKLTDPVPQRALRPATCVDRSSTGDGPGAVRAQQGGEVAGALRARTAAASWLPIADAVVGPLDARGTRRTAWASGRRWLSRASANARLGSSRWASCTRIASSPTSATSTMRSWPSEPITTPRGRRRRSGSARRDAGRSSSRRALLRLVTSSNAPSLNTLQFWKISTNDAPRWSCAARNISIMCLRSRSWVRATKLASAPSATASGLNGGSTRAERRALGDLADLGRRRVLALGQPVDAVVEQQDRQVDVAAQGVDQVVAADRQPVAVAGDHPHVEVGPGHGDAGGDGRRAAVDAVHAVGVHVVREAAASSRCPTDEHGVLGRDAELGHQHAGRPAGCRSRRSRGTSGPLGRWSSPSSSSAGPVSVMIAPSMRQLDSIALDGVLESRRP